MSIVFGQVIFFRVRRICQIFVGILFILIIGHFFSKKSSIPVGKRFEYKKDAIGRPDLAKYIHLDLKGAPPKADQFYPPFFEFLVNLQMGVKGILIEYEDTLPLEGKLLNTTHRFAYTKSDVHLIVRSAKKHQLELIPLIQTFGHLEWILKLEEWKFYRDNPNLPTVISPCINETYILLEDLLRQTLTMHPNSHMIHIGCDEVVLTNAHRDCSRASMSTYERYLVHIERVVQIVQKIRPGIRVLIWDDILRNHQSSTHQHSLMALKNLIEPVSWNYFQKFDQQFRHSAVWDIYPQYFSHLWAASAFKGGLHRYSISTNTTHHVLNNLQWLYFLQSSKFRQESFSAIILTGWSRFDHFMPLCDLLPTAYSSLVYSLHVLSTNEVLFDENIQQCDDIVKSLDRSWQLCELLPGQSIWSSISLLSNLLTRIGRHLKLLSTVAPDYNRRHSFIRRYELNNFLTKLTHLWKELTTMKRSLYRAFSEIYHDDVIEEWFDLYIGPVEREMNITMIELSPTLEKNIWPRRPLD